MTPVVESGGQLEGVVVPVPALSVRPASRHPHPNPLPVGELQLGPGPVAHVVDVHDAPLQSLVACFSADRAAGAFSHEDQKSWVTTRSLKSRIRARSSATCCCSAAVQPRESGRWLS